MSRASALGSHFDWATPAHWDALVSVLDRDQGRNAIEVLKTVYSGIFVYHGTRASSDAGFREHGLQPKTYEQLTETAIELFRKFHPTLSAEEIQRAAARAPKSIDGHVFTFIDSRMFDDVDKWVLRSGSEWIAALATWIDRSHGTSLRAALESTGSPLVVRAAVDWRDIDDFIEGNMPRELDSLVAEFRNTHEPRLCEWAFATPSPIPPHRLTYIWPD